MRYQIELFRKILLQCEEHEHGYAPKLDIEGFTEEQIGYHTLLLGEAGYMKVSNVTGFGDKSPKAIPVRLTYAGHEFAQAIRSEDVWAKTKHKAVAAGAWTIKTLAACAIQTSMQLLLQPSNP